MDKVISCPVCGSDAGFAYVHPEANIYRCRTCTHAFSDEASIRAAEQYSPDYYEAAHRNWFSHPNFALFDLVERQIPSGATSIIDVGCGRGHFLDYLRSKRPSVRLVGVDLSENTNRHGIEFHRGDILELQLGTFDAVASFATIEHVSNVGAFTRRIHDLCNPGGRAFVMTLDDGSLLYRAGRIAHRLGISVAFNRLYSSHHLHHFTNKSLVRLLENNDLRVQQTFHHSVPLKALDLPVAPLVAPLLLSAVKVLFEVGNLTGHSYLQTLVAVRET
jgi:2-polyprenyl-3-methyl-5-hydroxy-6-metoxy-1,4-benzoquinol methylase